MQAPRTLAWAIFVGLAVVVSAVAGLSLVGTSTASAATGSVEGPWTGSGPTYVVTFSETGLPAGTNWTVEVYVTPLSFEDRGGHFNTSRESELTFALPNGTYNFRAFPANGYDPTPYRGSFAVNGASPPPIALHFGRATLYTVTFTETGLPTGTRWGVVLQGSDWCDPSGWWCGWSGGVGGGFNSSRTNVLTFRLPNGTYNYTVLGVPGFSIVGLPNGSVSVSGASPPPVHVTFAPEPTYRVTFTETGLPKGTNWTVVVAGVGLLAGSMNHRFARLEWGRLRFESTSATPTITFNLTNGSYRYGVLEVLGFYSNDSFGKFSVVGTSPATIVVNFTAIPQFPVTFCASGLPAGADWGIAIAGVTVAVEGGAQRVAQIEAAQTESLTFSLPQGHYVFRVLAPGGWAVSGGFPGRGFVVSGNALGTTLAFSHPGGGHAASVAPSAIAASRPTGSCTVRGLARTLPAR